MPLNNLITIRKGSEADWISSGAVLTSGEPGFDTTNSIFKIGDGVSTWDNLLNQAIFSDVEIISSASGSTPFSVEGTNGALFSVVDNLSGTLMSVNNNAGLPVFEVFSDDSIIGGRFGQNDFVISSSGNIGLGSNNPEYKLSVSGNVNISGDLIAQTGTLNRLIFNTSLDDPNLLTGELQWNSTEGTLDLGLDDSYAMHLGEEMLYRVRNTTGSTLLAGSPVYASGLSAGGNNRIEVNLYAADGTIREIRFMGLITEDLPDAGNNGYATHFGYIRGIDTRGDAATYGTTNKLWSTNEPAWNEGDILYVHPTVPGKLTKIEPKHSISVAIVTNVASNGKLFVRPTSYGHLDDNHDVSVSGVSDGQFLQYNSSTDYWVPSSSGNFTTLLVGGTGVSVNGHIHTSSDISNFNSSVSGLLPTITNSGDNRILTSTGSVNGINAESNLTFDGTSLKVGNPNPAIAGSLVVNGNIVTAAQSVISSLFSIYGNTNNRLEFQNNSITLVSSSDSVNHAFAYNSLGSRINRMILTNSGVGIGSNTPVSQLDVSGVITATGGNSNDWNAAYGWGDHSSAGYAPLSSPALTGVPTAPTASSGTNTSQIATTAFVRTELSNLVDSAPGTLDTLNELAAALGDDPNFATTVTNNLSTRVAGTGTIGYIPKFTAEQTIQNSLIYDNGSRVSIGSTSSSLNANFNVSLASGASIAIGTNGQAGSNSFPYYMDLLFQGYNHIDKARIRSQDAQFNTNKSSLTLSVKNTAGALTDIMTLVDDNVGIGITDPDEKLEVNGNIHLAANGTLYFGVTGTNTKITDDSGSNRTVLLARGNTFDILNAAGDTFSSTLRTGFIAGGSTATHNLVLKSTTGVGTTDYISLAVGNNGATEGIRIINNGNVGIGTTSPEYKLQVNGSFGATTKSFRIKHPTKLNHTLEYGSLESPYHGVRLTGRGSIIKGYGVVELPDYLKDLIHNDETINIQITNIKHSKTIYVDEIDLNNNQFIVRADRCKTLGCLEFFWTFTGIRKDVDNLIVEKPLEE